MTTDWQNWSGNQQHSAEQVAYPQSEDEVAELFRQANRSGSSVRPVGSAHSFVPFWSDGVIVSLDRMKGLVSVDKERRQATFQAGTKLFELGQPLFELGLAMENMGDIDRQSVAGAISTGTHGTGPTLRNVSSQVVKLRLVKADGDVVTLAPANGAAFKAAQVSLGSLGIITEVTLQLLPAYFLQEKNWQTSVDECAAQRDEMVANNRHWEFFWDPASDSCAMKTLNLSDETTARVISEDECIGPAHEVIPSSREHKFNEIEFSVPKEQGWDCFMALRQLMQTRFPGVRWPLEYRTLAADDILLSSAYGRDTVTISAHEGVRHDYRAFFLEAEALFRSFDGRPHWGKVHSQQAAHLREMLPEFDKFCAIREEFDPEGRMLNSFLASVFGIG